MLCLDIDLLSTDQRSD